MAAFLDYRSRNCQAPLEGFVGSVAIEIVKLSSDESSLLGLIGHDLKYLSVEAIEKHRGPIVEAIPPKGTCVVSAQAE